MFLLHSVLVNWKCLPLQKADWELRKAQKVCLSLGNWKSILKLCFPVSILSEQRGKLFSCVCVKKNQITKAIYNWFFYLKGTREGELVFALVHQGIMAVSLCANDLFWKADFTPKEILEWGTSAPWSVCKENFIAGNQHPAFPKPVHMQAKV